ncbi:MAG: hypothetical protein E4H37_01090 [Gemmatimonadales bacterium]|nr:MAG: hypothetical protein E4H37_01090 [Gemmatimonadales bacterium]
MEKVARLKVSLPGLLLGLVAAVAPLHGQNACELVQGARSKGMEVGSWASYQTSHGTMKQAIVGQEERDGKAYFWMEMAVKGEKKGENVVMKMLVAGWENMGEIKEIIMQPAGQQAMRMPERMMSMFRDKMKDPMADVMEGCGKIADLGEESVTVPAGTFTARHYRGDDGDMWLSKDMSFFLVKATGKDGSIELAGHGSDATSAITGPIQDMPGF